MMAEWHLCSKRWIALIVFGFCLFAPNLHSNDQETAAKPTDTNHTVPKPSNEQPANKKATRVRIDPEQESRVLELASAHMPELSRLLNRLRSDEPRGYAKAIRDLSRSSRKLQLAKERDEHLYELELELWKANNHVNLLVARLKVRDGKKERKQLKEAVARQQQAEMAKVQYNIDTLRRRIDRAQKQLASAEERFSIGNQDRAAELDSTYEGLLRRAGRSPDP